MKKFILAAVLTLAAFSAFAQQNSGKGPDFKNRISSGIVTIDTMSDTVEFSGLYNNTSVELLSGNVDCGIDVTFGLLKPAGLPIQFTDMNINDWYIEFRPFDKFTFGIHDLIFTHGSYFPVLDTNIDNGNIGSDITVIYRPIPGIRVGLGYGIPSFFGEDNYGDEAHPVFNLGADFTYGNKFSIGFSIRDIINNFAAGIYGEVLAVENLYVTYGYTYNNVSLEMINWIGSGDTHNIFENVEKMILISENIVSLGATYKYKKADFALDFAYGNNNFISENLYYFGTKASYGVTDAIDLGFKYTLLTDFDGDSYMRINPTVDYSAKSWSCGIGFNCLIANSGSMSEKIMSFPVYFEFSL